MKKLNLLVIFLFPVLSFSQTLEPQSVFCATGTKNVPGYAQITWTLGDNQVTTLKNERAVLTQGFLQSRITITGIDNNIDNEDLKVKLYPNPVKDILQIEIDSKKASKFILDLYSNDGKILMSKTIQPSELKSQLDFSQFPVGLYILKVSANNKSLIKSYKVFYQY